MAETTKGLLPPALGKTSASGLEPGLGLASLAVGIAGGELALLRSLPWGKNWHVGGYF